MSDIEIQNRGLSVARNARRSHVRTVSSGTVRLEQQGALFGEGSWDIGDPFVATAGLRYFDYDVPLFQQGDGPAFGCWGFHPGEPLPEPPSAYRLRPRTVGASLRYTLGET